MGQTTPSKAECSRVCPSYSKVCDSATISLLTSILLVTGRSDLPWVQGSIHVFSPRESFAFSATDLDPCLISTIIAAVLVC